MVPTVEEVASPVPTYPEEDGTPPKMGTRGLFAMQNADSNTYKVSVLAHWQCLSSPKDITQTPKASPLCP